MSTPIPAPPPDASPSARGLISTGDQEFAGQKVFDSPIAIGDQLTNFTPGPLPSLYVVNTPPTVPWAHTANINYAVVLLTEGTTGNIQVIGHRVVTSLNNSSPDVPCYAALMTADAHGSAHYTSAFRGIDSEVRVWDTAVVDIAEGFVGAVRTENAGCSIASAYGGVCFVNSTTGSSIDSACGLAVFAGAHDGTSIDRYGIAIETGVAATHSNISLLIGPYNGSGSTPLTGAYAIASFETNPSILYGSLHLGALPTSTFPVSGYKSYISKAPTGFGSSALSEVTAVDHLDTSFADGFVNVASVLVASQPSADASSNHLVNATLSSVEAGGTHNDGSLRGFNGTAICAKTGGTIAEMVGGKGSWQIKSAGGTPTVTAAYGLQTTHVHSIAGTTVTKAAGLYVQNVAQTGAVTNKAGIIIDEVTNGTHNTDLLLGTNTVPTSADYALYSASTRAHHIGGPLEFADGSQQTTAAVTPILAFSVTAPANGNPYFPPGYVAASLPNAVQVPLTFNGACHKVYARARASAAANSSFIIAKNGGDVATVTILSGQNAGTVTGTPLFTFGDGDYITCRCSLTGAAPTDVTVSVALAAA